MKTPRTLIALPIALLCAAASLAADRTDVVAAPADFSRYSKIMVNPITISYADDSDFKNISPERFEELATSFRDVAVEALGDDYAIVDKSGSGVLRLELAVTELDAQKKRLLPTPIGLVRRGIQHTTERHYTLTDAVLRVEILDSQTEELLVDRTDRLSFSTSDNGKLSREEIESRIAYHVGELLHARERLHTATPPSGGGDVEATGES